MLFLNKHLQLPLGVIHLSNLPSFCHVISHYSLDNEQKINESIYELNAIMSELIKQKLEFDT